ncbi:hypothetical protein SEA_HERMIONEGRANGE_88 [Mycobacterium phage HermioneGrange]|nr:hypothetical protein SEA_HERMIONEGRANGE_88 [Mycobacterium phage HermioneGrange]
MSATDTLNPTQGLSFNLADLHGYVTGTLYGDWGTTATSVFAMCCSARRPRGCEVQNGPHRAGTEDRGSLVRV